MAEPNDPLTPEKRLLKLIEEPESEAAKKEQTALQRKTFFSLSALRGRLAFAREQWAAVFGRRREPLALRQINQILKVVNVGLAGCLLLVLLYEARVLEHEYRSYFSVSQKSMAEVPPSGGRKVDPFLFEEAQKQNVFLPLTQRLEKQAAEPDSPSLKLVELAKDLKLAGISVNPDNDASTFCMIEDVTKGTTQFLRMGDSIAGMKVAKIDSDGVVLKQRDEEIVLR